MKTLILRTFLVFVAVIPIQEAMSQSYKESELFINALSNFNRHSIEDHYKTFPQFFNPDGTHKVYGADSINADFVELILEDRGGNMFAIVDTTILKSSKCSNIISTESTYLLIFNSYPFHLVPFVEKINAFCDRYFWEVVDFNSSEEPLFTSIFDRPDYHGEQYYEYFDKHARTFCNKPYLEYPINSQPSYYMLFLMTGKTYNALMSNYYSSFFSDYIPIEFPDPSAYYKVLVPVFQEMD